MLRKTFYGTDIGRYFSKLTGRGIEIEDDFQLRQSGTGDLLFVFMSKKKHLALCSTVLNINTVPNTRKSGTLLVHVLASLVFRSLHLKGKLHNLQSQI